VLIVGGSLGMSGAVALAGLGALRGGAGLVFVAAPRSIMPVIAGIEPSYLTVPLPETDDGRISAKAESELQERAAGCDAMAIGPGIGRSKKTRTLVVNLFHAVRVPMVIDADALNALSEVSEFDAAETTGTIASGAEARPADRILTPHPGEFSRLIGSDVATVSARREELAVRYAERNSVVLVLKGHRTLITDGRRIAENTTGNSGMATGGTGDVLTGLIAALLGQGMPAFDAARLAVHLHGLAGDLAAAELSKPGLIASDLPRFLPQAWKRLQTGEPGA
jgi:NAD(P)H-hydrate epimerase